MDPKEFERRLMCFDPDGDEFPVWIDALIVGVPEQQQKELIPAMLKYAELNPEFNNDAPGTMVHFIEAYSPSYKALLLESLARNPSQMCLLMVNRILNSKLEPTERIEFTHALRTVHEDLRALASVRSKADYFLKYQLRQVR